MKNVKEIYSLIHKIEKLLSSRKCIVTKIFIKPLSLFITFINNNKQKCKTTKGNKNYYYSILSDTLKSE